MSKDPRERLQELLGRFPHAMLVTRSAAGTLHARPMALAEIAENGDLWFATGRDSTKVEEIAADSNVCVAFQDSAHFVSMSGRARVVHDRGKIDSLWREGWRIWYPQGKDDPNLVLLVVEAHTGEYWDNSGAEAWKFLFRAGKALMTGTRVEENPGRHHTVPL
jgi:general stress protein 26